MTDHANNWRSVAQSILTDAWGTDVRLGDETPLGGSDRSDVHRVTVTDGPSGHPGTVVVKEAGTFRNKVYDPDSPEGPAFGLLNDWAGLAFVNEVAPDGDWPAFYGGDRPTGIVCLEDLGAARQIDHILRGDDAAEAEAALFAYVAALAALNGTTAGQTDRYEAIRTELGPRRSGRRGGRVGEFESLMASHGLMSDALRDELAGLERVLVDPGPFLVYTHGDSCPDNCLVIDGRVFLLDFEWGRVQHALADGAYPWIHFPSCWCVNRLPGDLPERLLVEYRTRLAGHIPEAEDDTTFGTGLLAVSVAGFMNNIGKDVFEEDHTWGISTLRQRGRMRIRILADTAERFGHPATADACGRLGDHLDALWQELEPMPLYPAFRD